MKTKTQETIGVAIVGISGVIMKPDNKNYMSEDVLKIILEQLGWSYTGTLTDILREHNLNGPIVPIRADFYPIGWKLASSNKAIIICDGYKSVIHYKNERFLTGWGIYNRFGLDGLNDIENWNFEEEMEWLIKKYNGDLITSFTKLTDCPFRTTIRC